jgi:hypothetical protein
MVSQEPEDAVGVGRRQDLAGEGAALPDPVDPDPAVGIDHHLHDQPVGERLGDHRTHGLAQGSDLAIGDDGIVLDHLRAPRPGHRQQPVGRGRARA